MLVSCIKATTPLVAAGLITFLQWHAIEHGIDGKYLTITVAIVAGLGGYSVKELLNLIRIGRQPDESKEGKAS